MKRLIILATALVCVLGLVGCSEKEPAIWDWTKELEREDIVSVTPWSEENSFEALDDAATLDLVVLLNNLTKENFTENKDLTGGTPAFGIRISLASETFNINQSIHPNGALEIKYREKMWLIDNFELLDFVRTVTATTPVE